MIKVSDYIANFLKECGIKYVFAVTGGASVHLIDSIAKSEGIDYICPQHEQAGAIAADAYARISNGLGAAIATSGPGATNMLTGVCCAYYDSVPVIYITGQVSTFRLRKEKNIRQLGFQEADVVDIFKPVTKYCVQISDVSHIRYALEKAKYIALNGRKGPVLIDIPDNLQREFINPQELRHFNPDDTKNYDKNFNIQIKQIIHCLSELENAKRPVIILGWGVRLAGLNSKDITEFVEKLGVPVLLSWGAKDLLVTNHPLFAGIFGTHGSRAGNFIVQNSDFLLSIGCRLNLKHTGSPPKSFARKALKFIVDIDHNEIDKFDGSGISVTEKIVSDAATFINSFISLKEKYNFNCNWEKWCNKVTNWKETYVPSNITKGQYVNPSKILYQISNKVKKDEVIVVDTGCTLAWTMKYFQIKKAQRLIHAFNFTPMGYALPAAIGACFARGRRPVTCINGDGGFQMNIQELATIAYHSLPVKIFIFNNIGYGMIRQTQDQWLNSKYEASSHEHGIPNPDFLSIAKGYGIPVMKLSNDEEIDSVIKKIYEIQGSVFCEVSIGIEDQVMPQVKFGRPIEDSEPSLSQEEYQKNMIVPLYTDG